MADFGKALKFNKADGMIYLFRGRAMCAEEKFASAVKDFKTAIQLNAKDAEAHRNLALVLAACPKDRYRNGKRAVESAKQACELSEWKSWTALDTLAAAYAEAGDFDQARRWAEKAADLSYGANRDQCLARFKQYEARQPLRLDWKSNYGNLSAASESPISK
jgi:Flp pilus assembly protein TadD